MGFDSYGVFLTEGQPERFVLAFMDHQFKQGQPFMKTLRPMSEDEMRAQLEKMGIAELKVEELLQRARDHFLKVRHSQ